ncbi:hypothetical protein EBU95_07330 [bacterium]|nr:hypothetical protein [bacterium]
MASGIAISAIELSSPLGVIILLISKPNAFCIFVIDSSSRVRKNVYADDIDDDIEILSGYNFSGLNG